MSYLIKSGEKPLFIHTDIDSGGMSVCFTDIIYADQFSSREDAESFMARCQERYPKEVFEIVEHAE